LIGLFASIAAKSINLTLNINFLQL